MLVIFRLLLLLIVAPLATLPAQAHFSEGTKLRTILLAKDGDRLTAFIRTPAPLIFADTIEQARAGDVPLASPFLKGEFVGSGYRYRIPAEAIAAQRDALAERIAGSLIWTQDGKRVDAAVAAVRLRTRLPQEAFDTAENARAALERPSTGLDPDFGSAYFEIAMVLAAADRSGPLKLRSAFPAIQVAADVTIDNHIIDARGDAPVAYTIEGQLEEPRRRSTARFRARFCASPGKACCTSSKGSTTCSWWSAWRSGWRRRAG